MKGTPQITQRNPGRNHIEPVRTALQKLSQHYYPNGVESQSPGLAALFAAYPGDNTDSEVTLKGLRNHGIRTQPLQGRFGFCSFPRVGCKKRSQPWALRNYPFGVVLRQPLQIRPIAMWYKQDGSEKPSAQIHLLKKQGNVRTYVITDSVLEYLDWEKPSKLPLEKPRWKLEKKARWLSR